MTKTFAERLREKLTHLNDPINVETTVTIPLEKGGCSEEVGDELVLWFRRHGIRARRMDRHLGIVRFGFEDEATASKFRHAFDLPQSH